MDTPCRGGAAGQRPFFSRSRLICALTALVALPLPPVIACSCQERDLCVRVEKVPVIFLGEVMEGGLEVDQDAWNGTARSARLQVIEAFRGLPADATEVVVQLSFIPGMCSPMPYRKGQRTLVFVSKDEQGDLRDGGCTASSFADSAASELDYVRKYFKGQTKTTIRGGIAANAEPYLVTYLVKNGTSGVSGALVTAEGSGKLYTTTSDNRGNYAFSDLPAGSYHMRAELGGYTNREKPVRVNVSPRGCAVQNFGLWSNNSLEGFVYNPVGSPIAGLGVFLQKEGQKEKFGKQSNTSPQGAFHFDRIDPGRYSLVISPVGALADSPFEKYVYPDVLSIAGTSKLQLGSIQLPNPIATRTIRIRVIGPDNQPVENAALTCPQSGREDAGYPWNEGITLRNGVATCTALADRSYHIRLARIGSFRDPVKPSRPTEAIVPPGTDDVDLRFQLEP